MTATTDARERILDAAQQLVMERGFSATTVDAILESASASKGAFFHHFASKADLGQVLVERYAQADGELLEHLMATAEARTSDPAEQLIEFVAAFEAGLEDLSLTQPGCLFVSFIYEQYPGQEETQKHILADVLRWRERILHKLTQATKRRPPATPVDLESLADHVFTILEGGFVLARATGEPLKLRDQLRHLRAYLTLLLQPDVAAAPSPRQRSARPTPTEQAMDGGLRRVTSAPSPPDRRLGGTRRRTQTQTYFDSNSKPRSRSRRRE
jgi:TetR/AcrR family transcriptional repressor of nem operon